MPNIFDPNLLQVARSQVAKAAGQVDPEVSAVLRQVKAGFTDAASAASGAGEPAMDPAAAMGGPIPPPMEDPAAAAGGGGGIGREEVGQMIQAALSTAGAGGGATPGAGVEPVKPKIDEPSVMLQILKILAKIADHLQIPIPASDMVATSPELTDMANQSESQGAVDVQSAISPIEPIQGASPDLAAAAGGNGKTAGYAGEAAPQPRPLQMSHQAGVLAAALRRAGAGAR